MRRPTTRSPAQIAEQLADTALGRLVSSRGFVGEQAIPQALALLREDVQRLAHLLGE
jgi:hypothetical protein